jgi:hypothetical protein
MSAYRIEGRAIVWLLNDGCPGFAVCDKSKSLSFVTDPFNPDGIFKHAIELGLRLSIGVRAQLFIT